MRLLLTILYMGISQNLWAQNASVTETSSTPSSVTAKKTTQTRASLQALTESQVNTEKRWSVSLDYMLSTDLNDSTRPRALGHTFSPGVSYLLAPSHIIWAETSFAVTSLTSDNTVVLDEETKENFLSDIEIGYTFSHPIHQQLHLKLGANNAFPASPFSQAEGYRSVSGVSGALIGTVKPWLRIITSTRANYIWNTYSSSPNSHLLNRDYNIDGTIGALVLLPYGFSGRINIGVRTSHYLDNTFDLNTLNSIGLGYDIDQLSFLVTYLNGSYADQEEINLFFVDEYRQLTRLMVSYQF